MADFIFPDVSEFQPGFNAQQLKNSGIQGVVCRVAYGTRLDKMMPNRIAQVRAAGFKVAGYYLFLRASQDVAAQVNTVIGALGDLHPGEFIAVDWETDGSSFPSVAQRDQAAALFEQRYHQPTVIYASASTIAASPTTRPVWVAAYGVSKEPAVKHAFWQYTDGKYTSAGIAPVNFASIGTCDTSVYHGTPEQFLAAIGAIAATASPSATQVTSNQVDDMTIITTYVHIPSLDDAGNGWTLLDGSNGLPKVPADKVVGLYAQGSAPAREGYWPLFKLGLNNTNGLALITMVSGPAKGAVGFYISYVA